MRASRFLRLLLCLPLLLTVTIGQAAARTVATVQSRFFDTSDGVRLHYLDAGPPDAHVLVFIPGWTMPAWIWAPQIAAFARQYHVIAFDPRGQGESQVPGWGYDQTRRGQDIAELIAHVSRAPVVVIGWSLGVLDTLAFVHIHGDAMIAGLVLVDNSVGEDPPPVWHPPHLPHGSPPSHEVAMRWFVQGMFHRPQDPAYLSRLTAAALHTPEFAARALLSYPVPRTYWRDAIYSTAKPVLYIVLPGFETQARNLQRKRPNTETALFPHAGHALFVDDASRFNALLASFLLRRIWP